MTDSTNITQTRQRSSHFKRAGKLLALTGLIVGGSLTLAGQSRVQAAACAAPAADLGAQTLSFTAPADATYTVWTRMIAADASNNAVNLQVDTNTCFNVGGGAFAATTWADNSSNWVNYADGAPSAPIRVTLTAGTHSLKFIGTKAGVAIDRIIVSSDLSCTPTGIGTNCQEGDSTPPTVNLVAPAAGASAVGDVTMSATAADASGIAQVAFLVDGEVVNIDDTSPYSFVWNSASVANGAHQLTAQATDKKANTKTSDPAVTVTTANTVSCTDVPSTPANLRVSGTTASSISLSWDASTPGANCQIKQYLIFRDGVQVSSADTGTTYSETGLAPGASYSYAIVAVDTANHKSAQSTAVTASTGGDSQAPTTPDGLRSALVTSSSIALTWDASTDNNAVTAYVVYRNGVQVGIASSNAYTDRSVAPNTTYAYTVAARDAANNTSGQSDALTAKTLDGPAGNLNRMFLNPATGNFSTGSNFTVSVMVNTNSDAISVGGADLAYSSNLEFVSIDVTDSAFSGGCPTKSGGNGKVSLGCFAPVPQNETDPAGSLTGEKLLAKINFKVLSAGTGVIDIQDTSSALSATTSEDVLTNREDGSYSLQTPTTPPVPPTPPNPPAPTNPNPPAPTNPNPPAPTNPNPPAPTKPVVTTPPAKTTTPAATNTSAAKAAATAANTTTTIAPTGNANPVTLPNNSEVELSDPVTVQTVPDATQTVQKVEYYLNGKLIATIKQPPFSYSVQSKNLKNGTYKLTTRTYYEDGTVDTKNANLVVKNPLGFKQIMLQFGGFIWIIVLLLIAAAAAAWFFFFRKRGNDDSGYDGDDGYMFGPTGPSGPSDPGQDPQNYGGGPPMGVGGPPPGPTYGPPPPPAPYSGMDTVSPQSAFVGSMALSGSYATPTTFGRY